MIYVRGEGERIRNGFNFYSMKDPSSRGFIFRLWRCIFYCRYSLKLKEWIMYSRWINEEGFFYGRKPK